MKKTIIHLYPYKFVNHDYKLREFAELKKKFNTKIIIHDLSKIFYPNLDYVKAKSFNGSLKFKSLKEWKQSLDKLKKKNTIILNELSIDNFKSLIIHYYLKNSKLPIFLCNRNPGVISEWEFFSNTFSFKKIIIKLERVIKKPYLLFFFIKKKILEKLFFLIRFENITILIGRNGNRNIPFRVKNKKIIKIHSNDYSNFLNYKKTNIIKKNKPIIFLDAPLPYFMDDETLLYNQKRVKDVGRWYKEHNMFFDKLENFFSTKVIVVPHPKAKGVENPFFKKRIVDHRIDAALKLTPSSLFVLSGVFVSTAISFAIASSKPIFFIFSEQMKSYFKKQIIFAKGTAKLIGTNLLDINNFKKNDITKNFKVSSKLYDKYKYRYLTDKKLLKKPNHIIFGNLL